MIAYAVAAEQVAERMAADSRWRDRETAL